MAGHNRHLRGNTQQIRGGVNANVVIEPGDLVGINTTNGYYGPGTYLTLDAANYKLYPFSGMRAVTPGTDHIIATTFMGVALTGSAAGTTNEIVVAVDGIFRYPLIAAPSAVTLGAKVSSVSGTQAAGVSNQTVAANADRDGLTKGSSAYLGVIVKTESGASFVDFQLITATSGGSIA